MRTSKPCRAVLWLAATFFLVYLYHTINHRSLLPGAGKPSRPSVSAQGDWAAEKAEGIKDAFRFSWAQYERFAAPHDTLRPVSRSFEDDRNGWGATAVDGLSTAILMEEREIVDKILRQIASTDFSKTAVDDQAISVFESTIRYLGGLLSGYDLLTGPFAKLSEEPQLVNVLLEKAVTLADRLSIAFDTPSGVPDDEVIFNPKPHRLGNRDSSITCIGTLVLEWTRLSDLTGNTTYAALAQRAQNHLLRPKYNGFKFPGLLGTYVRLTDGEFEDYQAGWGGGSDSYYEYLIKMFAYDPVAFAEYRDNWVAAAESSMRYLASSPTSRSDLTFLGEFRDNTTVPISSHLASVCGGSFILGGLLLQDQAFIDFGLELAKSYYEVYRQSPSGIGPETFRWVDDHQATSRRTASLAPPKKWASFYEVAGYWSTSPEYILRPETIESLYYAYRATGDRKWQTWAWEAFEALEAGTRVAGGYSGLHTTMKSEEEVGDATKYRVDKMESFWLAETLKYLYMIFSNDDEYQVKQGGRWVLNTEAHPLRARDRSK
ncbi:1,2-a-D-mannosidase [Sarocladium strictum]